MSDTVPIQCPNCGGYKVEGDNGLTCLGFLKWTLHLMTGGITFVIEMLLFRNRTFKRGQKMYCTLCGYRWVLT